MRGHKEITDKRIAGYKPQIVFINDFKCYDADDTVSTAGDTIRELDLRFLHGLVVSISSDTEKRAKELFNACKQAGCKTVAANHVTRLGQPGWAEIWSKE